MAKGNRTNPVVGLNEVNWEAEEDLRCYQRVCKVKKDPKRMQRVHELAKEKLDEAAKVAAVTEKGSY